MSRDALIVGISTYQCLPMLKASVEDAEAISKRLEKDDVFNVRRMPERIVTDVDGFRQPAVSAKRAVSTQQLKQALKRLFLPDSTENDRQAPETALFYFSGHGLPDEDKNKYDKGYLATSDIDPNNPSAGLSFRWLQWLLSESPVKQQIIWLDCCHSGSFINVAAVNPGYGESRDRCFIASSRAFESSWEDLNSPYSVLTKALLDGLNPNRLSGRCIDTFSLVDFVNHSLRGKGQTPVFTHFGESISLTKNWRVEDSASDPASLNADICPYKGLEFFDCQGDDPEYFFGREQLVRKLLDHVRTHNFLALVGASGNGKSSVLRAGLIHQLKMGRQIIDSDQWQIVVIRPDAKPMESLAQAFVPAGGSPLDRVEALGRAVRVLGEGAAGLQRLLQASTAPRTLLVIDQFEEVFTRCDSIEERTQFFECLMGVLSAVSERYCIIITMRADFVGKCLAQDYGGLAQRLTTHTISVLPLAVQELKAAICRPAEKVNLVVEPTLVTAIINDIKDAPGSLPLLQYTLKELWQHRQDRKLLLVSYQRLGGINGTLDKRATDIYNSFDVAQQSTVQHIFRRLTQPGQGAKDTRRRALIENLITEPLHPAQRVQLVLETLASPENRLLVTSEMVRQGSAIERRAIVDVAHEALIRHWQLLRRWTEEYRDLFRQQSRIEESAISWQGKGEEIGYLLQGVPLIEAVKFKEKQAKTFPLSETAKAFILKSVWRQRWRRCKLASWLIIPTTLIGGLVEYNIRETRVTSDYVSIGSENKSEQRRAVQALVAGCHEKIRIAWLPTYFVERAFGNCRPLEYADLSGADLRGANLRGADLRGANLRGANLRGADLRGTNLFDAFMRDTFMAGANLFRANLFDAYMGNANLSSASLSGANLISADLRNASMGGTFFDSNYFSEHFSSAFLRGAIPSPADYLFAGTTLGHPNSVAPSKTNLSNALLLSTNLSSANGLIQQQLVTEYPPFICNSPLPAEIEIEGGMNRDCDYLPEVLLEKYPDVLSTLEEAQNLVDTAREETSWE